MDNLKTVDLHTEEGLETAKKELPNIPVGENIKVPRLDYEMVEIAASYSRREANNKFYQILLKKNVDDGVARIGWIMNRDGDILLSYDNNEKATTIRQLSYPKYTIITSDFV